MIELVGKEPLVPSLRTADVSLHVLETPNQICGGANEVNVYTVVLVWQNLGCYTDTSNSQTPNTSMFVGGNTVEKCQSVCQNAGTEFGSQCLCGNALMNQGVAATDGCTEFQDDLLQVCGGGKGLSIMSRLKFEMRIQMMAFCGCVPVKGLEIGAFS